MKRKKVLVCGLTAAMLLPMVGCGSKPAQGGDNGGAATSENLIQYSDLLLGKDCTDLSATITMFNHRTDMDSAEYGGKNWESYLADFNKMYPNIKVEITTDTDYAEDALTHLQSGDYETIMGIPAIDKADLGTYFMPYGDYDTMSEEINFVNAWKYDDMIYGVPSTATAQGIVYNKAVFKEAGITQLPKTPTEFIDDLQIIKDNTDAIPLYTNYAAEWTMGAWDAYFVNATGDSAYQNQKFIHAKDPFKNFNDETHPYALYKILYDAVANGLTEEDYTTTDWEGCKGMINRGEIACMTLGSWAVPQMKAAGENADDIGYMAFPISVDGKQYALAGADYSYGINVNASEDEKQAAIIFVKWLTELSGFTYNEDGLPIDVDSTETTLSFEGVELVEEEPAISGEEDLLNELNAESELNFNAGGNTKIMEIVEHAANKDLSFDEIMDSWNASWSEAQEACGVEVTE